MSLGEKIKAERKRGGLTQEELAEKICVSRQAIQKWESDSGVPSIENLKAISQLFGVSIDTLVENEGLPPREDKTDIAQGGAVKWMKAKWKIIVPVSVFLVVAIVLCALIPTFKSIDKGVEMPKGMYYLYEDGEYNTKWWLDFDQDTHTWRNGATYGDYKIVGTKIKLVNRKYGGVWGEITVEGDVLYVRGGSSTSIYKKAVFE